MPIAPEKRLLIHSTWTRINVLFKPFFWTCLEENHYRYLLFSLILFTLNLVLLENYKIFQCHLSLKYSPRMHANVCNRNRVVEVLMSDTCEADDSKAPLNWSSADSLYVCDQTVNITASNSTDSFITVTPVGRRNRSAPAKENSVSSSKSRSWLQFYYGLMQHDPQSSVSANHKRANVLSNSLHQCRRVMLM